MRLSLPMRLLPLLGWFLAAAAQAYPTKPIRFIVPYPPGGTTDIVARGIGTKLGEQYGQQVVIDNRGGASTIIGAELTAKAAPDGHTLLLATATTLSINPNVVAKLPYDPLRDFAPVTQTVYVPFVIAAHPSVPANSVGELLALARAKPGSISYSTPGTASTNHLGGALLEYLTGVKLLHVPFKGSGPAAAAVVGGQVNFVITGIATVLPFTKAGKLKVLAFASPRRHPSFPDIPSTGEAGIKNYEAGTWFSVVTRAGTPRPVVNQLNRDIVAALNAPDLRERLTAIGFDIRTQSPEEFARFIRDDLALTAKVIKAAGITLE
jgi:tripartite-type tricarboxylate transporter receptor subunit TctC